MLKMRPPEMLVFLRVYAGHPGVNVSGKQCCGSVLIFTDPGLEVENGSGS